MLQDREVGFTGSFHVPAGQSWHALADVPPAVGLYLPPGQAVQGGVGPQSGSNPPEAPEAAGLQPAPARLYEPSGHVYLYRESQ